MKSSQLTLVNRYNKIRSARSKLTDAAVKLQTDKDAALSKAIDKINSKFEKRATAIIKRKNKLANEMQGILDAAYKINDNLAIEMALGREITVFSFNEASKPPTTQSELPI